MEAKQLQLELELQLGVGSWKLQLQLQLEVAVKLEPDERTGGRQRSGKQSGPVESSSLGLSALCRGARLCKKAPDKSCILGLDNERVWLACSLWLSGRARLSRPGETRRCVRVAELGLSKKNWEELASSWRVCLERKLKLNGSAAAGLCSAGEQSAQVSGRDQADRQSQSAADSPLHSNAMGQWVGPIVQRQHAHTM